MNLAPRSQRLLGQVLDGLVGIVPIIAIALLAALSDQMTSVLYMASLAWAILYYFLADGLHSGQSFGKRWLGMRVVGLDGQSPCTFGQSFVRNLLLAILGPIDWLFIFGEKQQRLGDILAGTLVISD
jgi:uncharacterized RDD family membrane protein YckC